MNSNSGNLAKSGELRLGQAPAVPVTRRIALLVSAASLTLVLISFGLAFYYMVRTGDPREFISHQALLPFAAAIYLALGVLIIARQPGNTIGWVFLSVGALYSLTALTSVITTLGTTGSLIVPPVILDVAIWLDLWVWIPTQILPTTFVLLLFPDGHMPSRRWWPVAVSAALGLVLLVLAVALEPIPMWGQPGVENPFGLPGIEPALSAIFMIGAVLLVIGIAGSLLAVGVRFRRSRGLERQQMKWLAYVGLLLVVVALLTSLLFTIGGESPWVEEFSIAFTTLAMISIAIAVTIAIVRFHLYDMDVIINRTLVYGLLTVSIVGLYLLLASGTGVLLQTNNQWAALLVTAILALIVGRPVVRALQGGVNRLVPITRTQVGSTLPLESDRTAPLSSLQAMADGLTESILPSTLWARRTWYLAAAVSAGIVLAAIPQYLGSLGTEPLASLSGYQVSSSTAILIRLTFLASLSNTVVSLALAVFLYWRKSHERMGLFLSYYLLAHGILFAGPFEMLVAWWPAAPWVNSFVLLPLYVGPLTIALVAIFPDGRFVPRWSRWLVALSFVGSLLAIGYALGEEPPQFDLPGPPVVAGAAIASIALVVGAIYAQFYRYRHDSGLIQRQQIRWVVFGVLVWVVIQMFTSIGWFRALNLPPGSEYHWTYALSSLLWALSGLILPITLTIAVVHYHLFDLDIIINRTLVFGLLTACIVLIYVLVVGAVSALFQTQSNWLVALVATGLVAVLFNPLRERLQRWINRLVYGQRDEPFEVLSQLGRRLENTVSPDSVYPTIVETVAQTLRLPYAAVEVRQGSEFQLVEAYGKSAGQSVAFPLLAQGEEVGRLLVSPRSPGESLTQADERLLRNIARQAGTAVYEVQLSTELQQSRQKIVTSREEERRRLRRDLHDGLGPALASLHLETGLLRRLIRDDPEAAVALVEEMQGDIRTTIEDIRRVVHELRPPALDDLGLVPALKVLASKVGRNEPGMPATLQIDVTAPDIMPPLPAAVEVAAYRIIQEALANVIHHANARHATVKLWLDHGLVIEVADDGVGFAGGREGGVGLHSMRERAAELGGRCTVQGLPGGGTLVRAVLPIPNLGN